MAKITPKVCPKSTVLPSFLCCFLFLCPVFLLVAFIPSKYRNKHMSHQKKQWGSSSELCFEDTPTWVEQIPKQNSRFTLCFHSILLEQWVCFFHFKSNAMQLRCNLQVIALQQQFTRRENIENCSWAQNLSHIIAGKKNTFQWTPFAWFLNI